MLQNSSATTITTAETKENAWKIFRVIHTRVSARHALPASTVKVVSIVIRNFHAAYHSVGLKHYV